MRLIHVYIILMIIPLFVLAKSYGLRELIDHANKYNQLVKSSDFKTKAKQKEIDAQESAYYPTLDIGASYGNNDPSTIATPGEMTTGYVSLGLDLYDGGRKSALVRAKTFEYQASLFEKRAFEKSLALNIINNYYLIMKFKSTLDSLLVSSRELKAQIDRIKRFRLVGLATQEEIDKLQAVFDDNAYLIENTRLTIRTNEENLWLNSGIQTRSLKNNRFSEPKNIRFEPYEKTKILQKNSEALKEKANAIDSGYLPQIRVEDTYTKANYADAARIPGFGSSDSAFFPDEQNRLMISANMRIFDNGRLRKDREAVQYQKMALDAESTHSESEQRMNFRLAGSRLKTTRAKLKSAKSGLRAARSTYRSIVKKFETGLVDNISYLDALKKQTTSEALYKATQYDYEIAKSIYYFYAGKSPREYIR
ncbi:MAG: TolC family protein [Campylobacterota bacterium]|nr:TolC family protein [Campylobacterota bacterium]